MSLPPRSWYHTEATAEELAGVFRTLADEIERCDIEHKVHFHWRRELNEEPIIGPLNSIVGYAWILPGIREVWIRYTLKHPRKVASVGDS